MGFYPLMFQLEGRRVLLVGGGKVAWRKYQALRDTGALFTVISPEFCDEFLTQPGLDCRKGGFSPALLEGVALAVGATDRREVNAQVAAACRERGVLCCICDSLEESDVIFPAVVTRGELKLAVSTCGEDPGLAKEIKKQLEAAFPQEEARRVSEAGQARRKRLGRE